MFPSVRDHFILLSSRVLHNWGIHHGDGMTVEAE
ncbi:hypothetical protein FOPG_09932 [Fusarium oxysporum f. sp. conglutinans race 2 54008]|uniref:Uncharacterized protein n=1 Tax=Fusarium oxysporum f. sp. conglutinans race 2 54008 TaxID=1089457 RepID=X0HFD0_FUSOX|nr:hypothetical protein FOPG_09932 [Fusarium oxysporum f. sp. conglutinans race 2 54008]